MVARRRPKPEDSWSGLTEESIRCRVGGHIWRPFNAHKVVGAFDIDEVCERCSSHRHSIISNRGEIRSRSINYAEGYVHEGGRLEGSDRDSMRINVIKWDFKL
jgi:hypothetical protein